MNYEQLTAASVAAAVHDSLIVTATSTPTTLEPLPLNAHLGNHVATTTILAPNTSHDHSQREVLLGQSFDYMSRMVCSVSYREGYMFTIRMAVKGRILHGRSM